MNVRSPTVIRPVRADPGFGSTENATLPGPFPAAVDVILSHGTSLVASQPQPAAADTLIGADGPPDAGTVREVGSIVTVHDPPCVTATLWPATKSVPVRAEPALAATVTDTRALPVPPDGLIASHGDKVAAVQAHALPVVTDTCDVPPVGPELTDNGVTLNAQGTGGGGGGGGGGGAGGPGVGGPGAASTPA